jgi:glycosyltransferase involved in cell wall biosynthesis
MPRATIIFDNFGPYHWARLTAASQVVEVSAIQVSATSAEYAWDNEAKKVGFPAETLFTGNEAQEVSVLTFYRRMAAVLDGFAPEAVFIPGWSGRAAFAALVWCLRNRVPAITMSESTEIDDRRAGWKEWIKSRIVQLHAAGLAGGTLHRAYLEKLGLPAAQVALGYDIVDNDYFATKAAEARATAADTRARHQLPDRYFLASARFIEKKNLPRLLEAYAQYRRKWIARGGVAQPWSLVVLGDGALRGELEAKRTELGLVEHVVLPGFKQIGDLPSFYALAGAFIHASTTEQWGLVVNEAMAAGLPLIVSNRCGCAADLVAAGKNGFTFDPFRVEELAAHLDTISAQPSAALEAMAQESRRIIAAWGPARFGEGVTAAIRAARSGGRGESLVGALLLRALMYSS